VSIHKKCEGVFEVRLLAMSTMSPYVQVAQTGKLRSTEALTAGSSSQFELGRKSLLERILSIIADVGAGEGLGALLLTTDLTVLLGSYYLLKTVRESLILAQGGAEVKAYSSAAQAILLFAVVPIYGWIASRINRYRLLRWTAIFFASNLLLFAYLGSRGIREAVPYFIWVGIFNVFMVAQLWAFATDLCTEAQGKSVEKIEICNRKVIAASLVW
jgi:AAA family ATP:ADP antiporter